jgi:drug/metabolite transporter (DMT)-like permease
MFFISACQLVSEPSARLPMLERGMLGGVANLCAFYAVSTLNLGVASCVMFTMPLWTAALAYVFAGQKWERYDLVLAASCLAGVVLVTQLWALDSGEDDDGSGGGGNSALGLVAALAFAIINADAALVVNTKLRNEAPMAMVLSTMAFASILAALAAAVTGSGAYDLGAPLEDHLLVLVLSLGLPLMMFTRNLAFSLNGDTTIAMLLYLEIALAFLWEGLLLGGGAPSSTQVVGALLIICGSCCSVVLKARAAKAKKMASEAAAAAGGGLPREEATAWNPDLRAAQHETRNNKGGWGELSLEYLSEE